MIRSAIKTDNIRSRSHAMTVTIADFARAGLGAAGAPGCSPIASLIQRHLFWAVNSDFQLTGGLQSGGMAPAGCSIEKDGPERMPVAANKVSERLIPALRAANLRFLCHAGAHARANTSKLALLHLRV